MKTNILLILSIMLILTQVSATKMQSDSDEVTTRIQSGTDADVKYDISITHPSNVNVQVVRSSFPHNGPPINCSSGGKASMLSIIDHRFLNDYHLWQLDGSQVIEYLCFDGITRQALTTGYVQFWEKNNSDGHISIGEVTFTMQTTWGGGYSDIPGSIDFLVTPGDHESITVKLIHAQAERTVYSYPPTDFYDEWFNEYNPHSYLNEFRNFHIGNKTSIQPNRNL